MQAPLSSVVIVGGGTAGWMTAAALARVTQGKLAIRLVESDDIGTIGVGESTIPMIKLFNQVLGIDEDEFMLATQATFKLGIEFVDWARIGDRYLHGFGKFGQDLATLPFYQYWLRMHQAGKAPDLDRYSINRMMSLRHKFLRADRTAANSPLADITHAFHLDAGMYAQYLRRYAEARGVLRTEGKVVDTLLRASDGHVDAVRLASGELVAGELFIDCSGFRGLLIEQALHTGFDDWSHWLPCDCAWAVPCELGGTLPPYTTATAQPAGWQWRIGLQHRTGNGHVYASAFMDDRQAADLLLQGLDGRALAEPKQLRFTAGRRKRVWHRNVVAIGLSSGFLEPLESTSIHLIQSTIARLIAFFPDRAFQQADIDEFNRQCAFEVERIRDFLILHYHATERDDTPFWRHVRTMDVPDTLRQKMDLWRARGQIVRTDNELFAEVGWLQVLHGQRIAPRGWHPFVDLLDEAEIGRYLGDIAGVIDQCVGLMPSHADFLAALRRHHER